MLTCHELFGFMSPATALEILNFGYASDKEVYRATLNSVAEARKVRPMFLEKKPRADRHKDMAQTLTHPNMEPQAGLLIRSWLLKTQTPMLVDFLDALGVPHKEGVVDELPPTLDDAKLTAAVEAVSAKYDKEKIAIYLNVLCATGDVSWPNLQQMLQNDSRLQLG
jgi:hypothetical protein